MRDGVKQYLKVILTNHNILFPEIMRALLGFGRNVFQIFEQLHVTHMNTCMCPMSIPTTNNYENEKKKKNEWKFNFIVRELS